MKIKTSLHSLLDSTSKDILANVQIGSTHRYFAIRISKNKRVQFYWYLTRLHGVNVPDKCLVHNNNTKIKKVPKNINIEKIILKSIYKNIYKQFSDCSWMNTSPSLKKQKSILDKIQYTIEEL